MKLIVQKYFPAWIVSLLLGSSCAAVSTNAVDYGVIWDRSLVDGTYQIPQALIRTSDGGYATTGYGTVGLVPGGVGVETGF